MRRTLIILSLMVSFVLTTGMAAQAVNPIFFMLLGQWVTDQRQKPIDNDTMALNVVYNTMWNGTLVGSNPDPRTLVAANCRGTTLMIEPGQMGRRDIVGFEVLGNNPYLPTKIGVYHESLTRTETERVWQTVDGKRKKVTQTRIVSDLVDLSIGANSIIKGNPMYCKWQIPLETIGMPQMLYQLKIRVFFIEKKAGGFLNTGRVDTVQREETMIRFGVVDPAYMELAANSPEIQANLRASFGLMGGPPQIGGMNIAISPEMARNLPQPGQVQPPAQQAQPLLPAPPVLPPAPPAVAQLDPQPVPVVAPPPSPQQEVKATPITMVVWLGATKQIWRDQPIPLGAFKEGHAVTFFKGNTVIAQAIVQLVRPESNLVEIRIAKGVLPPTDPTQFSMEVK